MTQTFHKAWRAFCNTLKRSTQEACGGRKAYYARKKEEEEHAEEEIEKILVILSRIIKIYEEELQNERSFKELEEFVRICSRFHVEGIIA
jgi:hypothetical protein